MAQLAIKGHLTRGEEVIEILEMLGGKNIHNSWGVFKNRIYTIDEKTDGIIDVSERHYSNYNLFTLEEFLGKFPYKIGDKILYKTYGINAKIKTMLWNVEKEQVFYRLESNKLFVATVDELKPYKKEVMEEIKIDIPKGYEFAGVDDDKQQVVFTKIQPKYPKTYEECARLLNTCCTMPSRPGYKEALIAKFQELLICRDAYWEIGGDWKYDVNKTEEYFYIVNKCGRIVKEHYMNFNHILAFPTEEMRDAFYENFKELINQCKELL